MTVKNFYTVRPYELEPGDVLIATVTLHIQHHGPPFFRMYRCPYPAQIGGDSGVPQGSSLSREHAQAVAEALFPVVIDAGMEAE